MDPLAKKYVGFGPFAYCGGNPIRIYDPNGSDWRDFLKGLAVGIATNIIPGPSSRRDISRLDNKEDYNSGLKAADATSAVVASGMIAGGDAGIGAGAALVVGGASIALSTAKNATSGYQHGKDNSSSSSETISFTQGHGENAHERTLTIPKGFRKIKARTIKDLERSETRMGTYDENLNRIKK